MGLLKFDRETVLNDISKNGKSAIKKYNLRGIDLRDACLHGANLQGADLCGADLRGANLHSADLREANLRSTNLRGIDLRGADLRGANIDYSAWPLWCGGLNVKVDIRIAKQLAYHLCRLQCDDAEYIHMRNSILDFANGFHRVNECGKLQAIKEESNG